MSTADAAEAEAAIVAAATAAPTADGRDVLTFVLSALHAAIRRKLHLHVRAPQTTLMHCPSAAPGSTGGSNGG